MPLATLKKSRMAALGDLLPVRQRRRPGESSSSKFWALGRRQSRAWRAKQASRSAPLARNRLVSAPGLRPGEDRRLVLGGAIEQPPRPGGSWRRLPGSGWPRAFPNEHLTPDPNASIKILWAGDPEEVWRNRKDTKTEKAVAERPLLARGLNRSRGRGGERPGEHAMG